MPVTDPEFGRPVPCACVAERSRERRWREGIAASRLGRRLATQTFENFARALQPVAFDEARDWSSRPVGWVVLYGSVGAGKSHLLAACANALIRAGRRPLYWEVTELLDHLREGYADNSFRERILAVQDADVLLLDDYGTESLSKSGSTNADEIMFRVLNHRYGEELPTAISTNLKPGDFPHRIRSRMGDVSLVATVTLRPGDYRLAAGE